MTSHLACVQNTVGLVNWRAMSVHTPILPESGRETQSLCIFNYKAELALKFTAIDI